MLNGGGGAGSWRARAWPAAAVVGYAALLLLLRPATPFEWDEVQFQQALDRYDVSQHWPHPPGYPVYVAAGKLVRAAVGDPLLALEVVGVLAAVVTLVLVFRAMRRLGAPRQGAAAAAVLLAFNPAFVFYANVGLSDVPGVAAAFGACLALLWASDAPKRLPFAAIVCALALGVRPQLVAVMAPLGVYVLVRELRQRQWREVGLAGAASLATVAACWVPAILLTGAGRFFNTLRLMSAWVATQERGYRLPAAPVKDVFAFWLVRPFGSGALAVLFWALVLVGAWAWWRRGQRRLVLVATSAALCYLLFGVFSMNFTTAVRYGLPALPFLALLAAGVTNFERPFGRVISGALLGLSILGGAAWVAPPFLLRLRPAPVWEALDWVAQHFDHSRTFVVFDAAIKPHATYVLSRASMSCTYARPATAYDSSLRPHGQVLIVAETPIPGFPVIFERRWHSSRLRRLTRERYVACVVMATPEPDQPVFSPDWRFENGRWYLLGAGLVHLPPTARPAVLRLCAGDERLDLTRAGFPDSSVPEHECVEQALTPGTVGDVRVAAPPTVEASMPPGEILPLQSADARAGHLAQAYMLPLVAHLPGRGQALWLTDLVVANPHTYPLPIVAAFLPTSHENLSARRTTAVLGPDQVLEVNDVLRTPQFRGAGELGALLVAADETGANCGDNRCGFLTFSHTYNANPSANEAGANEWLPGLPPDAGLRAGGRAEFADLSFAPRARVSFGLASWTETAVRVRRSLLTAAGGIVSSQLLDLPRFGHVHLPLDLKPRTGRILVELVDPPPQALVFPYLSVVDGTRGLADNFLPAITAGKAPAASGPPPWPPIEAGR